MKNLLLITMLFSTVGCKSLTRLIDGREHTTQQTNVDLSLISTSKTKIIVAMGQSNILGRGQTQEFPNNPHVTYTRDIHTGPAYYAASLLAYQYTDTQFIVVQCSEGGTSIDRWVKGGDRYDRCVQETNDAVAQTGAEIIGIMFYQGEANARDNASFDPSWPEKFMQLIGDFRNDTNTGMIPLIWAELGQLNDSNQSYQDNWRLFKQNLGRVSIFKSQMVKTDDQPTVDDVHHGYQANEVIGTRFYNVLSSYLF